LRHVVIAKNWVILRYEMHQLRNYYYFDKKKTFCSNLFPFFGRMFQLKSLSFCLSVCLFVCLSVCLSVVSFFFLFLFFVCVIFSVILRKRIFQSKLLNHKKCGSIRHANYCWRQNDKKLTILRFDSFHRSVFVNFIPFYVFINGLFNVLYLFTMFNNVWCYVLFIVLYF
jgi:hypothetical protein